MYGIDGTQNAAHGSDSPESAERELNIFFNQFAIKNTPNFNPNETTCLVIKPHLLVEGNLGSALTKLQEEIQGQSNLEITEMKTITVNKQCAEEFLEVYKGVLPDYSNLVLEIANRSMLVIALGGNSDVVNQVRRIAGPHDPAIAKNIRPNSLRAAFGKNLVQNGVHVTDLQEDGVLECEYFFTILAGQ